MFRSMLAIAVLLGVGVGGVFAAGDQVYLYGTLPTGKNAPPAVLKLLAEKATIHTCYEVKSGFLGAKKLQRMIIETARANRDEFIKTDLFQDLPQDIRISATWTRVSVLYGSAYYQRPRWVNYKVDIKPEEMGDAIALTRRLLKDNLGELQEIASEKYQWLTAKAPVVHAELGYYIDFSLVIEALSLTDGGKWLPLFETGSRSQCFR